MNTNKLKVFLCHSSKDKPSARELYNQLTTNNFDAWFDEQNLLPGQRWEDEITRAMQNTDVVIVCLSKDSVSKAGYVNKEIKYAFDKYDEKPDGSIFIIPARLEICDVPERFKKLQWVDLFAPNGYNKLFRSLNECVAKKDDNNILAAALETKIEVSFQPEFMESDIRTLPSIYAPSLPIDAESALPRNLTITLRSTNNKEKDKRLIKTIYGTFISFYGKDKFSYSIFADGTYHLIDFPNDTTRICPELVIRLHNILNPEEKLEIKDFEEALDQDELPF